MIAFENVAYLVAAVLFILTFKGLAHPRTAVRANAMGAIGMLIAVVVTLFDRHIIGYQHIVLGLLIGSVSFSLVGDALASARVVTELAIDRNTIAVQGSATSDAGPA